ncbi:BZ3500_MvSof-1268-A1-R1_Chr1-3g02200 [Microbotryum saponariae]|uniref:BZ3500_MvSof-1268-A1-R1_Chr1-3g02200 protein n=1 Tax=Microbotryum saponariae TaxID=289078 RepID=A0A2X0KRT5_9BASI|nr:BZ3500_MvSof-1268-A1-R1_Chr1-3g02200 [Microbotryum saponariae]SCZ95637.1 BZ3501_MvSof-1269-A2-R1_Chr1-3g01803 [Microbotryum saponariae]
MSGGGGDDGGTGLQRSTADTDSPRQRQAPDVAVAAPGASSSSSSSSFTTSSSTPSGASISEGDSTSTSATSNPRHSYSGSCDTFDPRCSPSLAYGQQEHPPFGGVQQPQQLHLEAPAKHLRPPLPALSTTTTLQGRFDPPYKSFVQLHQPQLTAHHAQLYHAVESSRYNWDPLTGEPRSVPQDLTYPGLSVGETSPRPHTSSAGPSDRRVSFQLQQTPQGRNSAMLSSAVVTALRSGNEMTIGDLLEMSMSNTASSLASPPGSLVESSLSCGGPQSPSEKSDFVSPNQLETAEATNDPTASVPRVKPFIAKLEYLLSHPEYFKDCMVWDDSGTSFIVCHAQPRLLSEVLPSFYQHSSLHAFTRQLNVSGIVTWSEDPRLAPGIAALTPAFTACCVFVLTVYVYYALKNIVYGFARLSPSELISKLDITSTHEYSGWRHSSFTRDDHRKMHTLTPKPSRARAQKKVEKQEAQAVARHEAETHRQTVAKQKQQVQQQQQQEQQLQQQYQQQYQSSIYEHPQPAQTFQRYAGSAHQQQQQQQQDYVRGPAQLDQMDDQVGSGPSPFLAYSAYTFDAVSSASALQER